MSKLDDSKIHFLGYNLGIPKNIFSWRSSGPAEPEQTEEQRALFKRQVTLMGVWEEGLDRLDEVYTSIPDKLLKDIESRLNEMSKGICADPGPGMEIWNGLQPLLEEAEAHGAARSDVEKEWKTVETTLDKLDGNSDAKLDSLTGQAEKVSSLLAEKNYTGAKSALSTLGPAVKAEAERVEKLVADRLAYESAIKEFKRLSALVLPNEDVREELASGAMSVEQEASALLKESNYAGAASTLTTFSSKLTEEEKRLKESAGDRKTYLADSAKFKKLDQALRLKFPDVNETYKVAFTKQNQVVKTAAKDKDYAKALEALKVVQTLISDEAKRCTPLLAARTAYAEAVKAEQSKIESEKSLVPPPSDTFASEADTAFSEANKLTESGDFAGAKQQLEKTVADLLKRAAERRQSLLKDKEAFDLALKMYQEEYGKIKEDKRHRSTLRETMNVESKEAAELGKVWKYAQAKELIDKNLPGVLEAERQYLAQLTLEEEAYEKARLEHEVTTNRIGREPRCREGFKSGVEAAYKEAKELAGKYKFTDAALLLKDRIDALAKEEEEYLKLLVEQEQAYNDARRDFTNTYERMVQSLPCTEEFKSSVTAVFKTAALSAQTDFLKAKGDLDPLTKLIDEQQVLLAESIKLRDAYEVTLKEYRVKTEKRAAVKGCPASFASDVKKVYEAADVLAVAKKYPEAQGKLKDIDPLLEGEEKRFGEDVLGIVPLLSNKLAGKGQKEGAAAELLLLSDKTTVIQLLESKAIPSLKVLENLLKTQLSGPRLLELYGKLSDFSVVVDCLAACKNDGELLKRVLVYQQNPGEVKKALALPNLKAILGHLEAKDMVAAYIEEKGCAKLGTVWLEKGVTTTRSSGHVNTAVAQGNVTSPKTKGLTVLGTTWTVKTEYRYHITEHFHVAVTAGPTPLVFEVKEGSPNGGKDYTSIETPHSTGRSVSSGSLTKAKIKYNDKTRGKHTKVAAFTAQQLYDAAHATALPKGSPLTAFWTAIKSRDTSYGSQLSSEGLALYGQLVLQALATYTRSPLVDGEITLPVQDAGTAIGVDMNGAITQKYIVFGEIKNKGTVIDFVHLFPAYA